MGGSKHLDCTYCVQYDLICSWATPHEFYMNNVLLHYILRIRICVYMCVCIRTHNFLCESSHFRINRMFTTGTSWVVDKCL